jgi:hypothetical protein
MADQGKWFKLWTTAAHDPDLCNLSLDDFARWTLFGCYLKTHGNEGAIILKSPAVAIQHLFRLTSFEDVIKTLRKFPSCLVIEKQENYDTCETIVNVSWKNWHKYQGDVSTTRTQDFRDRERSKKRREEKRGEQKRREVKTPSISPPQTDDEWLDDLQKELAYKHLNILVEYSKAVNWYKANRKKLTRKKFVNWINRQDSPMANGNVEPKGWKGLRELMAEDEHGQR